MRGAPRVAFIIVGGSLAAALALISLVSSLFWCRIPARFGSHLYNIDFSIGCVWISDYAIWNPTSSAPLSESRATFNFDAIADVGRHGWKLLPAFTYTGDVTNPPPPGSRLNIRWQLILPLHPFFLALGIPSALMLRKGWKTRRHARVCKCPKCGYDMIGIVGPCPECGTQNPS